MAKVLEVQLQHHSLQRNPRADITSVNIYALKIGAPQYIIRQTLTGIKGEIHSNTIIAGDFNSPLTPVDRSSKQKINKKHKS